MRCPSCGKDSNFWNVDWDGFTHCPKCGAIDMTDVEFKKHWDAMLKRKQFVKEVERIGNTF